MIHLRVSGEGLSVQPQMVDGIEVAVEGSGPAMLVLHGTPGDWRQCEPLARRWRDEMTVIRPSRPGYGATPLHLGRTVHEQAVLMDGLLETLGFDEAVIVGVSGGGPFALAQAQDLPHRCRGLVLCCAVSATMPISPFARRMSRTTDRFDGLIDPVLHALGRMRLQHHRRTLTDELSAVELAELAADPVTAADVDTYVRTTIEQMALAGLRNDVAQFLVREELTCAAPTLVVHGGADETVPLSCAHHHNVVIPGAQLSVLPGRTHALPITAGDELDAALRSWMGTATICG